MTNHEDFIIQEPYQPTEKEEQAIRELMNKKEGLIADDWNSQNRYIKSFKNNMRDDMYNKQNKLCAYCRIHLPSGCVHFHREHIVYKKDHPQWIFLPENLCVVCPCCNEYKGATEVLVNPKTHRYPKSSRGFKIIHPLYDRYSDHIELIKGILYRGKTEKGKFTIKTCHLSRVELAKERVDQKMYIDNNGNNTIAELIKLTILPNQYVDDNEEFVSYVKGIVKRYALENNGVMRD